MDLDTLDTETRRAVQVVLHRMSREGRRALIHAANVEAVMDLPTGYMTNPWALPFFDDPRYRNDGHHAFYDLVEASTNAGIQPTPGRLHALLGAMRAGRA